MRKAIEIEEHSGSWVVFKDGMARTRGNLFDWREERKGINGTVLDVAPGILPVLARFWG